MSIDAERSVLTLARALTRVAEIATIARRANARTAAAVALALASHDAASRAFAFSSAHASRQLEEARARGRARSVRALERVASKLATRESVVYALVAFVAYDPIVSRAFALDADFNAIVRRAFVVTAFAAALALDARGRRGALAASRARAGVELELVLGAGASVVELMCVALALASANKRDDFDVVTRVSAGVAVASVVEFAMSAALERARAKPRRRSNARLEGAMDEASLPHVLEGALEGASEMAICMTFIAMTTVVARAFGVEGIIAHVAATQTWVLGASAASGARAMVNSRAFALVRPRVRWTVAIAFALGAIGAMTVEVGRRWIPSVVVRDDEDAARAREARVWTVLAIGQVVNAMLGAYEGFVKASRAYDFIREVTVAGAGLVFFPALFFANRPTVTLDGIWGAALALNVWRLLWFAGRMHLWAPRQQYDLGRRLAHGEHDDDDDVSSEDSESLSRSLDQTPLLADSHRYEQLLSDLSSSSDDDDERDVDETVVEEDDVEIAAAPKSNVLYESSLKPSKIKIGHSPIRTPELVLARASTLRANAGEFTPTGPSKLRFSS